MRHAKRKLVLILCGLMLASAPTVSGAGEKIEGKVTSTKLTLCQPRPTGGGCEGTLMLESRGAGGPQNAEINVTADTIIRKGQDYLFLPATQGSAVVISYVTQKGQKVAKSIDVISAAR